MSQWISIEAAAEKYRLEKEYIWLWVEMKKITVSYENDTVSIDDDSIQQFIKRTKLGITSEYIDELEQLCMEKNKTSRLYASLLNMRDQELMAIRGQSSRLDGLWKWWRNNTKDCDPSRRILCRTTLFVATAGSERYVGD